jgi:hypothetical protein
MSMIAMMRGTGTPLDWEYCVMSGPHWSQMDWINVASAK